MKHVWILNHYAQDPSGIGGTRHYHLGEHLKQYGWNATIIASSVGTNSDVQRLEKSENFRQERINEISFIWIKTATYKGNGLSRMLNMLTYSFKVLLPFFYKQLEKPDAIIGSSVHPFAALSAALLARKYKVPFTFEVRDLWPRTLIDMGRLKERSLLAWVLTKLETWLYKEAAKIVVLLPYASKYICPLGIAASKVVWIPNGVDIAMFNGTVKVKHEVEKKALTIMYLGAHGQANGLHYILEAFRLVNAMRLDIDIKLRLVGDGTLKDELIKQANSFGLSNVSFEDPVPKSDIPGLAAEADAFIINVLDLPKLYQYGISMNKIFDYLAAAKPIVIATSAINNPVKEAGAGFTVPANDAKKMAAAILNLANMSVKDRDEMGRKGRQYVENKHDFNFLAKRLSSVLDESIVEYVS